MENAASALENHWMEQFEVIKERLDVVIDELKHLNRTVIDLDKRFAVLNSEVQAHFIADEKNFTTLTESANKTKAAVGSLSGRVWWILGVGAALAFVGGLLIKGLG